jgi:hypothetical protein
MRLIGFFVSLALGFIIGTFTFEDTNSRYYLFKLYPLGSHPTSTTRPVKGFACRCSKTGTTTALKWNGLDDNGCNISLPPYDKPISLGDNALRDFKLTSPPPIPPIPNGACCKPQPRINNNKMPGVPTGNC